MSTQGPLLPDEATAAATASHVAPGAVGRLLPSRFEVVKELGRGGFGVVWLAVDRLLGRQVAVKWVDQPDQSVVERTRRELASLRLLKVAGVVEILDDVALPGAHLIVMAYHEGGAFPGTLEVAELARRAARLLEVLAAVHAAGVVHRDLKPQNVLVDAAGNPTVLDFGIATGDRLSARANKVTAGFVGTLLYAAPEQLVAGDVDARTDLFALGLMLYEAATGQPPHHARSVAEFVRMRTEQELPPVQSLVPSIPPDFAGLVNSLVALSPSRRPQNAVRALERLRGVPGATALPWIGSRDVVDAAVEAALRGVAVRVVAPPGAGCSRTVSEVAAQLRALGRPVLGLAPAQGPYGSLLSALSLELPAELSPAAAHRRVRQALDSAYAAGGIVFHEHGEGIDPWSTRLLAGAPGPQVRAGGPSQRALTVRLKPVSAADMLDLFEGPDRLVGLRQRAVEQLVHAGARFAGHVVNLLLESEARGDVRRLEGGQFRLLSAQPFVGLGLVRSARTPPLDAVDRDLVAWLALAWPDTSQAMVAAALDQSRWELELRLARLETTGHVVRVRGCYRSTEAVLAAQLQTQRVQRHRALGQFLPVGAPRRLDHLVRGQRGDEAVREARQTGRALVDGGRGEEAFSALAKALRLAADAVEPVGGTREAAELLVEAAVMRDGIPALDETLVLLDRLQRGGAPGVATSRPALDGHLAALMEFVRLLRRSLSTADPSLYQALEQLGPQPNPALELVRKAAQLRVARGLGAPTVAAAMSRLVAWRQELEAQHGMVVAAVDGILSLQAYREGRYREAELLAAAASTRSAPVRAARSWVVAGAAALELFAFDRALRHARRALRTAKSAGNNVLAGQAEWLRRTSEYRMGHDLFVDDALLAAVAHLGAPDLEAQLCATEAAVAFRRGERGRQAALAGRVVWLWESTGRGDEALLFAALAAEAGERSGAHPELERRARECGIPGIGIQVLGLLRASVSDEDATRLTADVPRQFWGRRLDLLSVAESLGRIRPPAPPNAP